MAGIGFELKKIVRQGSMASYLQVALSGAMIVAGPWLITIVSIGAIQRFYSEALAEAPALFLSTMVYTYTGSLLIFGGVHYLFSRILSDLLYAREERKTLGYLLWFIIVVGSVSLLLGVALGFSLKPASLRFPVGYRWVAGIFFFGVSLHWLFLVYASLLRWYGKILLIYGLGMALFVLTSAFTSSHYGVTGVLGGFALGTFSIILGFVSLILRFKQEAKGSPFEQKGWLAFKEISRVVVHYLKTQKDLIFCGYFYYFGIWIDKLFYWYFWGSKVEGSWFRVFPSYDVLVYYTNLTMIPGLVFFVIFTETGFATRLRGFLEGLSLRNYLSILLEKKLLVQESWRGLVDLALSQGCITLTLALLAPWIFPSFYAAATPWFLLGGVYFHLLYFVLTSFLFFLEAYPEARRIALGFFLVNLGLTLFTIAIGDGGPGVEQAVAFWGSSFFRDGGTLPYSSAGSSIHPLLVPGLGYFCASFMATLFAGVCFFSLIRRVEQRIFSRSAQE